MTTSEEVRRAVYVVQRSEDIAYTARAVFADKVELDYAGGTAERCATLYALCVLIERLVANLDDHDIGYLDLLICAYDKKKAELDDLVAAQRQAEAEAHEKAVHEHELAIKVTCPFCGSEPGRECRVVSGNSSGASRGIHGHKDRYRAAVHIYGEVDTA